VRSLFVVPAYPWPTTTGSRLRVRHLLAAARSLGEVELFAWVDPARHTPDPPPGDGPDRLHVSRRAGGPSSVPARLAGLAGPQPVEVRRSDHAEARRELTAFLRPPYDASVVVGARAAAVFSDLLARPRVVDFMDLEDAKLASRRVADPGTPGPRAALGAALDRRRARAWTRLQHELVEAADGVTVCSELDRERLGHPGAVVVPNGYPPPAAPAGERHRPGAGPPTMTFVGSFTYPPNVDAARYLAGEVAGELRRVLPGAQVRLVGRAGEGVASLHDPPAVVVVGAVERIEDELARADVVVVPVRHGGGTRVKVVEGFAHRVPVVATTFGAEGIDAVDGEHLLLADSPPAMADACARLVEDGALREAMVARAQRLFLERYQWPVVARGFTELLGALDHPDDGAR